eukprot:438971_1
MWYLIIFSIIGYTKSNANAFNECYDGVVTGHGTAVIDGSHLEYDIYDNKYWVYQCDEIIGTVDRGLTIAQGRRRLTPVINENALPRLWSVANGEIEVPYTFSTDLANWPAFITAFNEAKTEFDTRTNIRLVPYTNQNHYISMIKSSGCWSYLGDGAGSSLYQELSIGDGCQYAGIIIHEMLHALGAAHTQTREDRDTYVDINLPAVDQSLQSNFNKRDGFYFDDCGYYDYGSVMHYPSWAFSNTGDKTIIAKQEGGEAQMDIYPKPAGSALSQEDINCLNYIYRPNTIPVRLISTYHDASFYLRHSVGELYSQKYEDLLLYQQDSTFFLRPSLYDSTISDLVSFESSNYPGYYITHSAYRLRIDPFVNTDLYTQDASFYVRPALNGLSDYTSYESKNYPGRFIRDSKHEIWLHLNDGSQNFADQASFKTECTFVHRSEYTNTCPTDSMNFLNEPDEDCDLRLLDKQCDFDEDCPYCMQCCPKRKVCELPRQRAESIVNALNKMDDKMYGVSG